MRFKSHSYADTVTGEKKKKKSSSFLPSDTFAKVTTLKPLSISCLPGWEAALCSSSEGPAGAPALLLSPIQGCAGKPPSLSSRWGRDNFSPFAPCSESWRLRIEMLSCFARLSAS